MAFADEDDQGSLPLAGPLPVLVAHLGKSGGGPAFCLDVARDIQSYGGNVEVTALVNSGADNLDSYSGLQTIRLKTYASKIGFVVNLWRMFQIGSRIRRWSRREGPLVVVNAMNSLYQSIALPLSLPRRARYVVFMHDATDHPGERSVIKSLGRWLELRRADSVVVLSEAVGRQLRAKGYAGELRTTSLPVLRGVLESVEERLNRRPDMPSADSPVIGFFGRLESYKGIERLLGATERLRLDYPSLICEIWGRGPESRWKLSSLGGAAQWNDGWVPNESVADVLSRFHVLVLPYSEASQSGVVPLAAALGIATVVTPVGGLSEQVELFECGVVAADMSEESVADAIRAALEPEFQRAVAASGPPACAKVERTWIDALRASVVAPTASATIAIDPDQSC